MTESYLKVSILTASAKRDIIAYYLSGRITQTQTKGGEEDVCTEDKL
jgi:hypothetical protein